MIKPFKFFEGRIKRLYHYNTPYIPLLRTPPGSYYDRTINPDLYGRVRLSELSDRVQEIVRDPESIPAGYVQVPIPEQQRYDTMVIRYVRSFMRGNTNWRGYEEAWIDERNEYVRLKILGGCNIGGMMHITYEITTRRTTSQRYRVSVPLVNLQRRG
jgi:hypothetical protein